MCPINLHVVASPELIPWLLKREMNTQLEQFGKCLCKIFEKDICRFDGMKRWIRIEYIYIKRERVRNVRTWGRKDQWNRATSR
jgi:hypothetical protein